MQKENNLLKQASKSISVKLLDAVIIFGILAMALLIPYLSSKGGFTVSFNSMGGTPIESQKLRYGELATEPIAPTKEDCVFVGWYLDPEGNEKYDFSSMGASESITVFAVWEETQ